MEYFLELNKTIEIIKNAKSVAGWPSRADYTTTSVLSSPQAQGAWAQGRLESPKGLGPLGPEPKGPRGLGPKVLRPWAPLGAYYGIVEYGRNGRND